MAKVKKNELRAWIREQKLWIHKAICVFPHSTNFYNGQLYLLYELEKYFNLEDKE